MKKCIIYGPVISRRLGLSLGINVLPTDLKICSFNCLYCECGWTEIYSQNFTQDIKFPSVEDIYFELRNFLISKSSFLLRRGIKGKDISYFTLAGNGEPTLNPFFPQIIHSVIELRNEFSPSSKIAVLSNSTTLNKIEIIKSLNKIDSRIMKLDAGDSFTFNYYNNPSFGMNLEDITDRLSELKNVTIQTLFTNGPSGNYTEKNIIAWIQRLKKISPSNVQIYSLDRSYPSKEIAYVEKEELFLIKKMLDKEKILSEIY